VPGLLVKDPSHSIREPPGELWMEEHWVFSNVKEFFLQLHTKPTLMSSSEASQLDAETQETTQL
jgi:hypothetical protein